MSGYNSPRSPTSVPRGNSSPQPLSWNCAASSPRRKYKDMSPERSTSPRHLQRGSSNPHDRTAPSQLTPVSYSGASSASTGGGDISSPRAAAPKSEELLIPPLNFGRVCRGVYRSGFPGKKNFMFMKKLGLSSVLNLSEHEYPSETVQFFETNGIKRTCLFAKGNKEPFQVSDEEIIRQALHLVLDATPESPLLVHCTKGTHRTGCVVGCLRKLEGWSLVPIFEEYRRFAGTKVHLLDQQFIEFFIPTQEHVTKQVKTKMNR